MHTRVDKLPVVLTSFAYREEYFPELDGMLATVRQHHPDWKIVTGRGPVSGYNTPTLEVESPAGKFRWSLPVSLDLDETDHDWFRITHMMGWWITQVWHHLASLFSSPYRRIIWLDADGRLNGPLDFEVEPESETIAIPWWTDPTVSENEHHLCTGFGMYQGTKSGIVQNILDQWTGASLHAITLPPRKSAYLPGRETDQCLLTSIVKTVSGTHSNFVSLKLPYNKYCGAVDTKTCTPNPDSLVDQWMMNQRMLSPKNRSRNWPPPEDQRRRQPQTQQIQVNDKNTP